MSAELKGRRRHRKESKNNFFHSLLMPKELPANGKTAERVYITRNSDRFMNCKNTKIKINDSRLQPPNPNVPNFSINGQ